MPHALPRSRHATFHEVCRHCTLNVATVSSLWALWYKARPGKTLPGGRRPAPGQHLASPTNECVARASATRCTAARGIPEDRCTPAHLRARLCSSSSVASRSSMCRRSLSHASSCTAASAVRGRLVAGDQHFFTTLVLITNISTPTLHANAGSRGLVQRLRVCGPLSVRTPPISGTSIPECTGLHTTSRHGSRLV